jgi:hypothetical protein
MASPAIAHPAPSEIASYSEDFAVSSDEARSNLSLQSEGAGIVEFLRSSLKGNFAGVWFDNVKGKFYVPFAPGTNESELRRSLEHDLSLPSESFVLTPAQSTWNELETDVAAIAGEVRHRALGQKVSVGIDPAANAAVVQTSSGVSPGVRAEINHIVDRTDVDVEVRPLERPHFKVESLACVTTEPRRCDKPLRGGVEISAIEKVSSELSYVYYGVCTAGFKAVDGSGQPYMLSAGHCFPEWNEPKYSWGSRVTNETVFEIGKAGGYTFSAVGDWGKINASGSWWSEIPQWPSTVAHYWGNQTYPIDYEVYPYKGQYLCLSGARSGTSCGSVSNLSVSGMFNTEGQPLPPLVEVPGICLAKGDSGGPFFSYSSNSAVGILSSGELNGSCGANVAYFDEVVQATSALNVSVGQRIGGAPQATTSAATNIGSTDATVNGQVNPNAVQTQYWFEYGTTASYGASTPVPSANAGSGTNSLSVSAAAERLDPGTTYHYRLVAANAAGTSYGADQTLHTVGWRFMRGLSSGSGVSNWGTAIGMDLPLMATGDVNGDGKSDVVSVEKDNGLYRYKFGYSDGSGIPSWDQVLSGTGRPTRLAAGDFTGDGKADIIAVESEGNGKYRYMLGYGTGAGISNWNQVMSAMSYPHKLAVGDLTGDGKADIVAVESQSNGKYRYMLGKSSGSGISSWTQVMSEMAYAEFMDLGDFNADGKADVVSVENQGNGKFRFMFGISNGAGIGSWTQVMSEMAGPYFLNAGDFNADGKADIVSVEADGSGKYRYMLGTSNGAGIGGWTQVLGGMGLPVGSDLGDFTGDGKADVVSLETESAGSYSYRLGISSGAGVSNWNQLVSWMRTPRETAVGDFNADGKADLVSVESEGNGKFRYKLGLSNASGIVSNWKTVLSGMGLPNALAIGDLTGDGKADIVAVEPEGGGKYRYMLGTSNGAGVASWNSILTGMGLPTRMDLGDFSGDGKADIIAFEPDGSGKYRIMRGLSSGSGISSWSQILGGLGYPAKASVGDVTGDGKADIVSVESQGNGKYRYMLGKSSGTGISSWTQVMGEMAYAEFMDLGDFNADGKADVVSVENQGNSQFRFTFGASNGGGIGSWSQLMSGMAGPYFFHLGDLNGDGKADIVSAETM